MTACPPPERLRQFLEGDGPGEPEPGLAEHLETCAACQAVLERLTVFGAPADAAPAGIPARGDSTLQAAKSPERAAVGSENSSAVSKRQRLGDGQLHRLRQLLPLGRGKAAPKDAAREAAWPTIPGYEIVRECGRGGMAVVYEARDVRLNRPVALKMIREGELATPEQLVRFRSEGEIVARLRHPNIVNIYEVGLHHKQPFLALEWVEGGSLHEAQAGRPLPAAAAAELVEALAHAMDYAHRRGVLHRDLKPANILLAVGGLTGAKPQAAIPKIADFGLAKQVDGDARLTQTGCVMGTPHYMAPEQVLGRNDRVGPRTDVYALGGILYELLTGRPPFRGETPHEILRQVTDLDPPPPSRLLPGLPRDLDVVCLKCLEKDPERRYATAEALADDLRRFLRGEPVTARPVSPAGRAWRWVKRRPAVAALLALVVLLAASGFAGVFSQWRVAVANEHEADRLRGQAEGQRDVARRNLYQALVREAQSLRLARQPGYRERAWQLLRQAVELDVPDKDPEAIRREAAACLGDFFGREPATWTDFPAAVASFAFDPRGAQLALGLGDGTVMLRALATGEETARLSPPPPVGGAPVVAFANGGDDLIVASKRGEVQRWERRDEGGWRLADTFALGQAVSALSVTADGKYVAAGADRQLRLWDREAKRVVLRRVALAPISRVAVSPGGKWVVAAFSTPPLLGRGEGTPTVQTWEAATGRALPAIIPQMHYVFDMRFSDDERLLACACMEGAVVYRLPEMERVDASRGLMAYGAAFSPDGRQLAVTSAQEDVVRLWPFATGQDRTVLAHPGVPRRVAFSPSGRLIATAADRSVRVWNLANTPEKQILSGHVAGVPGVAFSPDGKTLASAGKDGTVRLWDPFTGVERATFARLAGEGQAVAFSPDGRLLAAGDYTAGTARVWDLASGREVAAVSDGLGDRVHSVAFSPDGRLFAVGAVPGLKVFAVEAAPEGAEPRVALRRFDKGPPEDETVGHLVFSPDGKALAWANNQGVIHVWDLETGQALLSPVGKAFARIQSLSFFPDSRRLIFLNRDRTAEVWDVRSREKTASFAASGGAGEASSYAMHLSLSPDGSRLAASSASGHGVNVWDVASGRLLVPLPEEKGIVWCLAWSPDGRRLAVSRSDGGLAVWDCDSVRRQLAELGVGW